MMTNSASRTLAEKSYNSIVASKQFGATNFNVWLGGSKSRGLSASYAGSNWQLGASAMQYTTERTVSTMLDLGTSSANTPSSQFDPLIPWKRVDKPQQEVDKDKPQQEADKDKPQQEVTKDKPRATMLLYDFSASVLLALLVIIVSLLPKGTTCLPTEMLAPPKTMAHTMELGAETAKLNKETFCYPVALSTGLVISVGQFEHLN
jgi:hypothetical protein